MLVKEMHIELELIAKRLAAKTMLRIKKQEADWFLNNAQDQFLESKRNPQNNIKGIGFQGTKKRMEELQTLITTKTLDLYKYDDTTQYAFLPSNFEMHNNDTYAIKYHCNNLTITETAVNLYYAVLPVTNLSDFYLTYQIQELTASNVLVRNLATHTGAIAENDQKFEIIRELKYRLQLNSDIEIYWEMFGNMYNANSFIFVKKVLGTVTKVRATNGVTNLDATFTAFPLVSLSTNSANSIKGIGRLTDESLIEDVNQYSFTSTIPESPISTIKDNKLYVYHDSTFIADSVALSIIRSPRPINVDLGWNCELHDSTHSEIVLLAARNLCLARGYKNVEGIIAQVNLKD